MVCVIIVIGMIDLNMFSDQDMPDEAYWVEVGGDGRIHPYGMHKMVNRDDVEVVNVVSDEDNHPKRWVIVKDGKHSAWVKKSEHEEYGYEVQPDERVSDAKLEAIELKQQAIQDGSSLSVQEARALVDTREPEQIPHALVALFYAAKADPDVTTEDLDTLREIMHENTRHVDTNHKPTLEGILNDVIDGE